MQGRRMVFVERFFEASTKSLPVCSGIVNERSGRRRKITLSAIGTHVIGQDVAMVDDHLAVQIQAAPLQRNIQVA